MCATTSIVMVARRSVRERAVVLAVIVGRSVQEVSKIDWEQAKRELTGEPAKGPKEQIQSPEAGFECPKPAQGHKVLVLFGDDDDGVGSAIRKSEAVIFWQNEGEPN